MASFQKVILVLALTACSGETAQQVKARIGKDTDKLCAIRALEIGAAGATAQEK